MITAVVKRTDVMNLIGGDVESTFEAVLAKRMLGNIQVSDFSPTPIVMLGIAMLSVILAGGESLVCCTIATLTDEFWATRIFAGFKRFHGFE